MCVLYMYQGFRQWGGGGGPDPHTQHQRGDMELFSLNGPFSALKFKTRILEPPPPHTHTHT